MSLTDNPGPPGVPRITNTTKSSITLEWKKPTYDGGVSIRGYHVEMAKENSDEFENVSGTKEVASNQFTVTNLLPDLKYKYDAEFIYVFK